MRHVLLLLLAGTVLLTARPASAQTGEASRAFQQGNEAFAAGEYGEALAHYRSARTSGFASGALFFNMGNAYFRLDSLGQAIRYYEKARAYLPDDPRLAHNVQIAQARTAEALPRVPEPGWQVWWRWLVAEVGAVVFFVAGLTTCLGAAALTALRIRRTTRSPWLRRAQAVALVLGLGLVGTAFALSVSATHARAVVVASEAALRETPEASTAPARTVPEGTILDVLGARDAWLEVRLPDGTTGWVAADQAGSI